MKQKIYLGTEFKLNIHIEPFGDITMDDYDFVGVVFCHPKKSVVVTKEEAIRVDSDNYVMLVDSNDLGVGEVKCKITAYIPDLDFPDGLRTEVTIIDTDLNIVNSL